MFSPTAFVESFDAPDIRAIHQGMFDDLWLVGGLNPSEKYEFVSLDDSQYIYIYEKMFQTTKQLMIYGDTWMVLPADSTNSGTRTAGP